MNFSLESFSSQLFYLAGIFIAFFSSFLIFGKRVKSLTDYLLAIWFLIIGLHLIYFLLIFSGSYSKFPYLLGLEIPLPLIHGPMLYLYILCLTGKFSGKRWLLHLAPAIIIYFFLLSFFFMPSQEKIDIYQNGGGTYKTLRKIVKILTVLSGILYVVLSTVVIKKYQKQISEIYSNTEKINLNWGYCLIVGISAIWIAVIIKSDFLIFSLVVIFILLAAYFGISHVGILNPVLQDTREEGHEDLKKQNETVSLKYQKTFAGNDTIQHVYEKLGSLMHNQMLYKDPELNLNQVAKMLDVHPNILSQTINSVENKNFYDYINRQRIEEFKKIAILPENQKFTILSLAFESGFNSKTSFNRNFKKYTSSSPREFLKNHNVPFE